MRTIDATLDSPIMLTKTDTNITTTVRFCVKPWLESYPGCVIELIHRRNQDAGGLPAAILETDGEYAYWLVTDADTAYAGYGEAELLMKSGEAKAKSPTYTTYVDKSVASDEETPPEPIERFVEQISDAAADAINAKIDAVSAKEDAESAKTAAETAKEDAETAARQAESASAHSPYIGENRHWYLWYAESETYVDTGITAEGKDGDDGISPEVTFEVIEGGHSMTVTDRDHPDGQTISIMDGADGEVPIDDTNPSTEKVYSSAKVAAEVSTINQAIGSLEEKDEELDESIYSYPPNVYDPNSTWVNGTYTNGIIVPLTTGTRNAVIEDFIPVKEPGSWVMSWVDTHDYTKTIYIEGYNNNKEWLRNIGSLTVSTAATFGTFTVPSDVKFIRIRIYRGADVAWTELIPSNIQIEPGTLPTEYKPRVKQSRIEGLENEKQVAFSRENLLGGLVKGYIDNSGVFKSSGSWYRSGYIPVEPGQRVYFYNINPFNYFAFFDEDKEWIGGKDIETPVGREGNMIICHTAPSGSSYMMVSLEDTRAETCWGNYVPEVPTGKIIYANKETLIQYGDYPTNPCDYDGMDACTFRKGICIGDSITAGGFNYSSGTNPWWDGNVYSYPAQFQKLTGITMTNAGHSGVDSVQWWNNYGPGGQQEIDLSGYDFAIIHLGINDVAHSVSIEDTHEAFENIIDALDEANKGIKIFVCTIIPAYANPANDDYISLNTMVKGLGSLENVYVCDLTKYGHEYWESQYAAGHLTAYGYWRMAKDLVAYIGYHMMTKPNEFRFIHFIGTDMTY